MKFWLRSLLAVVSGLLLTLVSAPYSWAWLHWVSFVPVFFAVHDLNRKHAFRIGYLSGYIAVFSLFNWLTDTITVFGGLPMPVAIAILGIFSAAFGLPYGLMLQFLPALRTRFGAWWVPLFTCVWVMAERLQPQLFPYFQGVGQYRSPWVWQLASVFGSMGVSFLVILVNAAVTELCISRGRVWRPGAVAAVLFIANLGFGHWRYDAVSAQIAAAPTFRVSILQQGISMVKRLRERGSDVLNSWVELTRKVAPDHPQLVVWPEGSIFYNPTEPRLQPVLAKLASSGNFALLLGGGTHEEMADGSRRDWNSAYMFDKEGNLNDRYDKMVPLPFGEYMPWPTSYLRPYIQGVGDFRAGTEPHIFEVDGVKFSTPICYEAILDGQMRSMGDGVDLYVNITNDAWFGDTAAPHQHAMLSAAAAMENGRPMVRIAYTGVSLVMMPNGDFSHYSPPFTDVAEVVDVPIAPQETIYRRGGWLFPWLCVLIGSVSLLRIWRDRGDPRAILTGAVTPSSPSA